MTMLTFAALDALIRRSVTSVADDRELTPGQPILELGIDSITTLNIIMTAAEEHDLDLARLDEFTGAPATLGELHEMLLSLQPADAA